MRASVLVRLVRGAAIAAAPLLLALSVEAQPPEVFRIVGVKQPDTLNVRQAPKSSAPIVGKIPFGATDIVRIGECKAWCQIRFEKVEGWVDRRYLEVIDSAQPPAAASADPTGDCNSEETTRKLVGCSVVITKATGPDPVELAIAHSRRSDAHIQSLNFDLAIADRAKAFELQPDDLDHKKRLAQVYGTRAADRHAKGKHDNAIADFSEAIRLDPSNPEYLASRSTLFVQKNDDDKAIADLEAAWRLDRGKTIYGPVLGRLYEDRGVSHLLKREHDRAIADFTVGLQLDPARESFFLNRATAYAAKKEYDSAYKDCIEASRINPDNANTYVQCGELARRLGLLHQAILHFDEAIKREPANIGSRMMRGLAYEETKQFDQAISDYEAALKVQPSHAPAKASLARIRGMAAK